jgi:cell filamentation protein
MDHLFTSLRKNHTLDAEQSAQFVATVAQFLAELNAIHPFREGNGRSQLAFVHLVGEKAGFPFDFSRVQRETFLPAMVASYDGDLKPLVSELTQLRT